MTPHIRSIAIAALIDDEKIMSAEMVIASGSNAQDLLTRILLAVELEFSKEVADVQIVINQEVGHAS